MKILTLNAGSSSQKIALFEVQEDACCDPVAPLWEGKLEWMGENATLTVRNSHGNNISGTEDSRGQDSHRIVQKMLQHLWSGPVAALNSPAEIAMAGHRIVHGGRKLAEPAVISDEVKRAVTEASALAPLHNRAGLRGIELIEELLPTARQIAVFDTGFHRSLPLHAKVYPGPYEWYERGIERYGFHGINHQYCADRTARLLGRHISSLKTVSCHLGNGCSLAAIDGGRCVDTTMGFTPLEGLMMGTRCGSIDPGILSYLRRTGTYTCELDDVLNHRSGLLGISGETSDMREIISLMQKGSERAELAFKIFVHRLRAGIAAMAASLGGLDALVFTAGIGENSPEVRRATCEKLGFLGIEIDAKSNLNQQCDREISLDTSKVRVLVIRAQEHWVIAQQCVRLSSSRTLQPH